MSRGTVTAEFTFDAPDTKFDGTRQYIERRIVNSFGHMDPDTAVKIVIRDEDGNVVRTVIEGDLEDLPTSPEAA